jgi:K+-transporting ATPase KdpF subunit
VTLERGKGAWHVAHFVDVRRANRVVRRVGGTRSVFGRHPSPTVNGRHAGAQSMALYVLMTLVALLVIYLFYAVIHPEKF